MDFDDSPEEAEYRAHVRGLLEQHAGELLHVEPGGSIDPATHQAEFRATQRVLAERRPDRHPVAARARRPGRHAGAAGDRRAGVRPRPDPDADQPHRHRHVRPDRHRRTAATTSGSATSPGCCAPTTSGASCSASRRPAPTWPRCAPPPSATARTGSSTGRRSGRRSRTSPTTASCSPAPTPTGPSTPGSTMFVVDMHAPGVTVRPLRQMAGGPGFNEVFFDDVRIPDSRAARRARRGLAGRADHADERAGRDRRGRQRPRRLRRGPRRARPRPAAGARARPAGGRPAGGGPGRRRAAGHPLHRLPALHRAQPGRPARARGQRRQAGRHRRRAARRRRRGAAARRRRRLRDHRRRRRHLAAHPGLPARAGDRRRHRPGAAQHPRRAGAGPAAGTAAPTRSAPFYAEATR